MNTQTQTYMSPPSALRYMLRAFKPRLGWDGQAGFPDLCLRWSDFCIGSQSHDAVLRLLDRALASDIDKLRVLLPHISGFRLLMVMLTQSAWPLPIWGALQVRNRLILRRSFDVDDRFDLVLRVARWRVLEKGVEVDLHSRLLRGEVCFWESVVTFYYRGHYPGGARHSDGAVGVPLDMPPIDAHAATVFRGVIKGDARWRFGALTGDYNGLHQWDAYARRFGFKAAFAHPQRIVAQCLALLPTPEAGVQQLDLWIKGPVYFGSQVVQRCWQPPAGRQTLFSLCLDGDQRPALLGRRGTLAAADRPW